MLSEPLPTSEDGYDRALWELLCEQIGAAALAVPEEHDGAGFSVFETLIVLDELGRSLAPSPLLASLVTSEALLATGDADACARLLPRIAAGEVATLAWAGVRGPGRAEPVRADGDHPHRHRDRRALRRQRRGAPGRGDAPRTESRSSRSTPPRRP